MFTEKERAIYIDRYNYGKLPPQCTSSSSPFCQKTLATITFNPDRAKVSHFRVKDLLSNFKPSYFCLQSIGDNKHSSPNDEELTDGFTTESASNVSNREKRQGDSQININDKSTQRPMPQENGMSQQVPNHDIRPTRQIKYIANRQYLYDSEEVLIQRFTHVCGFKQIREERKMNAAMKKEALLIQIEQAEKSNHIYALAEEARMEENNRNTKKTVNSRELQAGDQKDALNFKRKSEGEILKLNLNIKGDTNGHASPRKYYYECEDRPITDLFHIEDDYQETVVARTNNNPMTDKARTHADKDDDLGSSPTNPTQRIKPDTSTNQLKLHPAEPIILTTPPEDAENALEGYELSMATRRGVTQHNILQMVEESLERASEKAQLVSDSPEGNYEALPRQLSNTKDAITLTNGGESLSKE